MTRRSLNKAEVARQAKSSDTAITQLLRTRAECAAMGVKYVENSKLAPRVAAITGVPLPLNFDGDVDAQLETFFEFGRVVQGTNPALFDAAYQAFAKQVEVQQATLKLNEPVPYPPQGNPERGHDGPVSAPENRRRRSRKS